MPGRSVPAQRTQVVRRTFQAARSQHGECFNRPPGEVGAVPATWRRFLAALSGISLRPTGRSVEAALGCPGGAPKPAWTASGESPMRNTTPSN
eukprot:4723572-Pyramimonas_sp.AAC.1